MASDGFRETTASLVASSKEYQVLIWETAPGTTLDMLMSKAWRRKQDDASICACIWQVGDWLRRLHKSSNGQLEVLDFSEFQESLSYHRKSLGPSLQSYLDIAERTFDQTMRKTGTSLFNIPIARIHGDMTPPNILWSSNQNRLHVVDFEHFDVDFVMRDLVAFLSTIRAKAFQPWFKVSQLRRWERSFWKGYGIASEELCVATDSLTTAWLFYWFLPRYRGEISEQQLPGFVARSIYTLILEGVMAKHVSRQYGANAANAHVLS
jgi:Ser/Thr protein kinase RdoA (MazF antagonist)